MSAVFTTADITGAAGQALLEVVVAGAPGPILDIGFAEPDDAAVPQQGDLVLGAGLATADDALALVARAAKARAAGVVLKTPLVSHPQVMLDAERLRVPLLELRHSVSWAHLVWFLRGIIDRAAAPGSPAAGDASVHGDLFALADAAAAIVDAPVTIEDAQSRVLAHSSRQDRADPARVSTIVGRRVPEQVVRHFRARGVFRRLARSDEPIFVAAGPGGILPRLVVPVRAGGEWLGSIWAVVDKPVAAERVQELSNAAGVLALHLLRLRAQADLARRVSTEQLRTVLRHVSPGASTGLKLPSGPWRVAALAGPDGSRDARHQVDLWDVIARRNGWREPLIVDLDGSAFAVLTDSDTARGPLAAPGSWPWMQRLATELHAEDPTAGAAAGGVARSLADLPRARAEAAELCALVDIGELAGPTHVFEESWAAVVVHRAAAALPAPAELGVGPLPALAEHDASHGSDYLATLSAFLAHPGEPQRAAAELRIHPNSLRYRMRRIHDVAEIELGSSRERLALQLQLARLRQLTSQPGVQRPSSPSG